ncbi:MAG: TatD family hydrolase, partial [Sediminibacterium sp.]
ALAKNWPIVIHTRNAMQETIEMVKPFAKKGLRGIFHCFSGSAESAKQIIDLGFYLGIGGVITYKNAGLPEALANVPLSHLVLETDAPYLTPVPFRGKRNESGYLLYIAQKLAEVKQTTLHEVAAITTANAQKIFGS